MSSRVLAFRFTVSEMGACCGCNRMSLSKGGGGVAQRVDMADLNPTP